MYKLLYREANGDLTCRSDDFEKIFPTLYAYESTNLTPDCIKGLQGRVMALSTTVLEQRDLIDALQAEIERKRTIIEDLLEEKTRLAVLLAIIPAEFVNKATQTLNAIRTSEVTP